MREILFRGKRLDGGQWAYGEYGRHTSLDAMIIDRPYIASNGDIAAIGFWAADPATVGQYTGLTDKNGVKIFEGDIVRVCLNPEICVGAVEFDERVGAFIVKLPENKCSPFLDLYVARNKAPGLIWAEVIGNIHDNQEALKEEP